MSFKEKLEFLKSVSTFLKLHRIVVLIMFLFILMSVILYMRLSSQSAEHNLTSRAREFRPSKYHGRESHALSLAQWGVDPFLDPIREEEIEKKNRQEQERMEREQREREEKERIEREKHLEAERLAELKRQEEIKKRREEFAAFVKTITVSGIISNQRGKSAVIIGKETFLEGDEATLSGKFKAVIKKIEATVITITYEGEDYELPVSQ